MYPNIRRLEERNCFTNNLIIKTIVNFFIRLVDSLYNIYIVLKNILREYLAH